MAASTTIAERIHGFAGMGDGGAGKHAGKVGLLALMHYVGVIVDAV